MLLLLASGTAVAAPDASVELARQGEEFAAVRLGLGTLDGQRGLALRFNGSADMHYYATETVGDMSFFKLTVTATGPGLTFEPAVYPPPHRFHDAALDLDLDVYAGDFTVFLPLATVPAERTAVTVTISAQTCTSQECLFPFDKTLPLTLDPATAVWPDVIVHPAAPPDAAAERTPSNTPSRWLYALLALAAGLSINIMPCVLPVLPLVIMKLLEQSREAGRRRLAAGAAFCLGIVGFFAAFAVLAAVIQLATGRGINPNDIYRYPQAAITLFLFIVFFGLAMLDLVPIVLPTRLAGTQTQASSLLGSAGMGFFAGILSIPCSGALLGFVLVWAQTQTLLVSSLTFVLIGVGMALPYAVLILIPRLLQRIPKPGLWMDHFKKTCGFLLFLIAAKLTLAGLPKERLINVLMYGIVFAFCVWVWGQWVTLATPARRRVTLRGIAVLIAVLAGGLLLPDTTPPAEARLNWRPYDRDRVQTARDAGQPVLIKFTADWCTNCKKVERKVYQDPALVRLIKARGVLTVKADTTTRDMPATEDLITLYGEAGNVPVTVVLIPGQEPRKLRGIDIGDALRALLEPLAPAAPAKPSSEVRISPT